ncbi:hypothetical protein AWH56_003740 [Anaerobacillus isosaccharinicus]|uniref:Uncharacterized protein n=1 Tax=Anaerobacillus isosaccharinicus TaxID=1532552 RepID=A0A1S2L5X3_9BACI|nr:hypothetical protein [Anaerobacillus isosaccharinicus]MBA5584860.1 hypothetical protein [Anaerobacillus isosaccharinicus]QOY36777.1 hypothetical protein AWH56_003740 [Anaerobacillus isosaccharinicus]
MKLLLRSVIFSLLVHVIYIAGILIHGWYLTINYVPDIINEYENVTYLQNEVAFGYVIDIEPIYFVISFLLVALLGAVLIDLFNRIRLRKRCI